MATKKVVRRQKNSFNSRMIIGVLGLFLWTFASFGIVEVGIERFNNEANYFELVGLTLLVVAGFIGLFYLLGVRLKRNEE